MAELCDYLSSEGLNPSSPKAPVSLRSLSEDSSPSGPPITADQMASNRLSQLVAKAAQEVLNGTLDGGHDVPLMMAGGP